MKTKPSLTQNGGDPKPQNKSSPVKTQNTTKQSINLTPDGSNGTKTVSPLKTQELKGVKVPQTTTSKKSSSFFSCFACCGTKQIQRDTRKAPQPIMKVKETDAKKHVVSKTDQINKPGEVQIERSEPVKVIGNQKLELQKQKRISDSVLNIEEIQLNIDVKTKYEQRFVLQLDQKHEESLKIENRSFEDMGEVEEDANSDFDVEDERNNSHEKMINHSVINRAGAVKEQQQSIIGVNNLGRIGAYASSNMNSIAKNHIQPKSINRSNASTLKQDLDHSHNDVSQSAVANLEGVFDVTQRNTLLPASQSDPQQDPAFLSAQENIKRSEKAPGETTQSDGFFQLRPAPSTTPHISANEIQETPRSEIDNLNSHRSAAFISKSAVQKQPIQGISYNKQNFASQVVGEKIPGSLAYVTEAGGRESGSSDVATLTRAQIPVYSARNAANNDQLCGNSPLHTTEETKKVKVRPGMMNSGYDMNNSNLARHSITDVHVHDFIGNNQSSTNDFKKVTDFQTPNPFVGNVRSNQLKEADGGNKQGDKTYNHLDSTNLSRPRKLENKDTPLQAQNQTQSVDTSGMKGGDQFSTQPSMAFQKKEIKSTNQLAEKHNTKVNAVVDSCIDRRKQAENNKLTNLIQPTSVELQNSKVGQTPRVNKQELQQHQSHQTPYSIQLAMYSEIYQKREQDYRVVSKQLQGLKRQQCHAKQRLFKIQKDLKNTLQDNIHLEKQLNLILQSKLLSEV